MRIAFISTILGYPWGGADTLWTHAAEAANARGDQLFLSISPVVAGHPRIAALIATGATLLTRRHPTPSLSFGSRLWRKLGLVSSPEAPLMTGLRYFRPELVIFCLGGTYDLILHPKLIKWLQGQGIKYRVIANWQQEHPYLDDASLSFTRDVFAVADRLHFVSTRNLTVTRRHLAMPLPNDQVIQNPLRWQPSDVTPWPENSVWQLATVSRLDEGKGIQILLQALHRVAPILSNWRLNIYGQGPAEPQLRALTNQLGLDEHVCFRGYVKELRSIWAENHLMISPAIEDGVPMTIPEAMLCQRPVLATCVGGAEDWLVDGQTGFLCPQPTESQLAATLSVAWQKRQDWADMGRQAAHTAANYYRSDDWQRLLT